MQGNILGQNNSSSNSNLKINGIIEEYTVASGGNVNAGDFVSFVNEYGFTQESENSVILTTATSSISQLSAIQLSNNKIFILYTLSSSIKVCYGVVALIDSDNIINLATSVQIISSTNGFKDLIKLSDNKIFISYIGKYSSSSYYYLYAKIVSINDDNSLDVRFNNFYRRL